MREATFDDLRKPARGWRISAVEAALLPEGSLFCDKMGRWFITTRPSLAEITSLLKEVSWRYSLKLQALTDQVGEENVLSVRFVGHDNSSRTTKRALGEIPKLPTNMGSYHTHSNGWGDEFSSYTVKVGEVFEHQGSTYYCVHEKFRVGDAERFSTVGVLAVKLE